MNINFSNLRINNSSRLSVTSLDSTTSQTYGQLVLLKSDERASLSTRSYPIEIGTNVSLIIDLILPALSSREQHTIILSIRAYFIRRKVLIMKNVVKREYCYLKNSKHKFNF